MTRSGPAFALLSVSLLAAGSCSDQATLLTPDARPQEIVVAPQCFGRNATIYIGSPGGGTITPDGSGGYTITGTSGNDVIVGGPGNDVIDAGEGTDRVCGGDGDDVLSGGNGTNYIDGELGRDMVDYSAASAGVSVNLVTGRGRNATIIDASLLGIENIRGSAFDDQLRGDASINTIRGGDGNDDLYGLEAADSLHGQDGNDAVHGGNDTDVLTGGTGDDEIIPGAGADLIVGQGGVDVVNYNNSVAVNINLATNVATGGDAEGDTFAGIEAVIGTVNNDVLTGNDLKNTLEGRGGADIINGGGGRDRLIGGDGNDEIHGGTENDDIHGQEGDDELYGDDGDDVFVPGGGLNTLDGGNGTDRIVSGNCLDSVTSIEVVQSGACDADVNTSTVDAAHASIVADGANSTTITVQLKDAGANNFTIGGRNVVISTTAGTLTTGGTPAASVTADDQGDGSYTATLTAGTALETATVTATVDGNALTDDAQVAFTFGSLDHFAVTGTDDNPIGQQEAGVAFAIKIVARDANNHTVGSFTGTVDLISTPGGSLGTTASFISGVLASHSVTLNTGDDYTISATRTGGTESGTSASFTVTSDPSAVADEAGGASVPGDAFHVALNTAAAINVLTNDTRGFPLANVTHFGAVQCNDGAGSLNTASGTITANTPGTTGVDLSAVAGCGAGSSLEVNADGSVTFTPSATYTGLFRFQYRIGNAGGTSDAQVTLAVGVRPNAADDSYSGGALIGNVTLDTNTGTIYSVSANDAGDQRSVSLATPANGSVTLNSNGTFTFDAAVGYSGSGGFTYSVTNGFGSDEGTLSLTVSSNRIWFVNLAAANGAGTQASPFQDLDNITNSGALPNPQDNDAIFVYENAAAYAGPFTLRSGQKLIGQDATATLAASTGFTPATHQALPAMNTGGSTVTLASGVTTLTVGSGNTLRGFTITTGSTALAGTSFGTLTLGGDVVINTNGQALSLNTGALSGNFASVTSSGGTSNISLTSVTGASSFGTGALSGASGASVVVNGGTVGVTYAGSIAKSSGAGALLDVSNGHNTGTITLTGQVTATTGTGLQFTNADGIYNLGGVSASSTLNGGDAGVDILNDSDGTFTFGANLSITNPSGTAVNITSTVNDLSPTITFNGPITQNNSQRMVLVERLTGLATATFAGNLSTTSVGGLNLLVRDNNGGTVTFSGASKNLSVGITASVSLTRNSGATVSFTNGGLAINGIQASQGGTLNVSGPNNTIANADCFSCFTLSDIATNGIAFSSVTLTADDNAPDAISLGNIAGSGTIALGTVIIDAGSGGVGSGIALNATTPAVTASSVTIGAMPGHAVSINNAAGAVTLSGGSIQFPKANANAVEISGGSADISIGASLTKSAAGRLVNVTGRSGGTVTLSGNLSCTVSCTGINVTGNTGGTVELSAGTKTLNIPGTQAVTFSGNTGNATLRFSNGGLAITSGTQPGILASNTLATNATLQVQGSNNTISSTTGTALSVSNTTIGAAANGTEGGLNFLSINASDPVNGILLNSTGATAGLKVSGSGADGSGGTINSSSGAGIDLTNTAQVNLANMNVQNGEDDGIRGSGVDGLTLTNLNITSNGNAVNERGIDILDLTGSGGMSATVLSGSAEDHVKILNSSGTLSAFNVTGNTFTTTSMVTGNDAFLIVNNGSGSMSVTVANNTFTDSRGDHFQATSTASAAGSVTVGFNNNTLTTTAGNDPNVLGGGITINPGGGTDFNVTIDTNNIQQAFDAAINVNHDPNSTAAGHLAITINNNTIGTSGVLDSGSESDRAISIAAKGAGTNTVAVTNNTIKQWGNEYGIGLFISEGPASMNATVTGNSVQEFGTFAINAIRAEAGATATDNGTLCLSALSGNTVAGGGNPTDIRINQRFLTRIKMVGYAGGNSDNAAMAAFVVANNGGDATASNNVAGGGAGFTGGGSCP